MPSCSLDDFSGARGPLRGSNGNQIYFHGRHIFSSLLRDLVANYGIDQAETIVLVGSGSGMYRLTTVGIPHVKNFHDMKIFIFKAAVA